MITFININAASFSVFFQLPSPPLLLQDKTVAHPFQHFPQFHCQHRHVRVSSKVSVVSLPRTFESLESSSTNSFEVKSERFREIIYVYKMRKQILIMMMTVLLMRIFLEMAMMMVMIFLEVVCLQKADLNSALRRWEGISRIVYSWIIDHEEDVNINKDDSE